MFCPYINPETNKEYTWDYACCNSDNVCPVAEQCIEDFQDNIMMVLEDDDMNER